ncbi:unnamed protein product, partial [Brassica rapa]
EVARKLPYESSKLKIALDIPSDGLIKRVREKTMVSQWTKMMDMLEDGLIGSSIQYRRFDWKMSLEARHKAIEDFNTLSELLWVSSRNHGETPLLKIKPLIELTALVRHGL